MSFIEAVAGRKWKQWNKSCVTKIIGITTLLRRNFLYNSLLIVCCTGGYYITRLLRFARKDGVLSLSLRVPSIRDKAISNTCATDTLEKIFFITALLRKLTNNSPLATKVVATPRGDYGISHPSRVGVCYKSFFFQIHLSRLNKKKLLI